MAIRKLVGTVALSVLAASSFVIAQDQTQHRVTVQTRSGERIAARLQDVSDGIVFLRTSQNDERRLPIGDVVLIDLVGGASGLPDSELSVAARDEHLVVLRNGFRILSAYTTRAGEKIWVITEADRSATTFLLPEEY